LSDQAVLGLVGGCIVGTPGVELDLKRLADVVGERVEFFRPTFMREGIISSGGLACFGVWSGAASGVFVVGVDLLLGGHDVGSGMWFFLAMFLEEEPSFLNSGSWE
jgi:hypothetical protein